MAEGQQACHRSPWPEERRRRGNQQLGPLESGEHQGRGLSVKLFLGAWLRAVRISVPPVSDQEADTTRSQIPPVRDGRRNRTAFMASAPARWRRRSWSLLLRKLRRRNPYAHQLLRGDRGENWKRW